MNLTTTQQIQNPLQNVLVERPLKKITAPDLTGSLQKVISASERTLKTLGRSTLAIAGALGRIVVFSEADSPALGYKVSNRRGPNGDGQTQWKYDWMLYTHVARR